MAISSADERITNFEFSSLQEIPKVVKDIVVHMDIRTDDMRMNVLYDRLRDDGVIVRSNLYEDYREKFTHKMIAAIINQMEE